MMDYEIMDYGNLNTEQKKQAVELFMEGFGHMMTFSKNEDLKRKLLVEIFHPSLFKCYVQDNKILGLIGIATNEVRPIKFDLDSCIKYFGKFKGTIISKQMNAIFQKPVVKKKDELYIDVLVTGNQARRKGVGTTLLNYAFKLKEYNYCFVHVFSKNKAAINLYEKNGFIIDKKEKMSIMRFLGSGYPIRMKKILERNN